ncbi:hypothetical protein OUHCRE11_03540 [Enterobacter asburiae]|nr:hypothetical protein ENTKAS01_48680 [Enterobacter sp. AS-1]
MRSVYRRGYKLHGIGACIFLWGNTTQQNVFVTVVRLVKYALRETCHVLKEDMGINVKNIFIGK